MPTDSEKDDRLFAPFPIEMDEHPKIICLSDAAFRAVFEATFYSRRMMSDGFLDERVVLKRWGADVAAELSTNDPNRPSWVRIEGGWQIHDFAKHHPLRAEIEAKRADLKAKRSQAGSKGAAKRWQTDGKGMASDSSETETETETTTPNGVVSPRKRAHSIPASFSISESMRSWAAREAPLVDIDARLPEFIDFWKGTGKLMKDWEATWRNGMRKQQGFAERDTGQRRRPTRDDENMALVAELSAREQQQKGITA